MAFRSDLIELFGSLLDNQMQLEKAAFLADKERRENAQPFTELIGQEFTILSALPAQQLTPWEYAVRWLHSTYGLDWLNDSGDYVDSEPVHGSKLREFLVVCRLQDAGSHDQPDTEIASDLDRLTREGVTAELKKVLREQFGESLDIANVDDAAQQPDDETEAVKPIEGTKEPITIDERRAEWIGKALMLRKANPNMAKAEIARKVGIHPGQLSPNRFPELAELERMLRGDTTVGHLSKDSDSGLSDVEAVSPTQSDRGEKIAGSKFYREYCAECSEPMRVKQDQVGTHRRCEDCGG